MFGGPLIITGGDGADVDRVFTSRSSKGLVIDYKLSKLGIVNITSRVHPSAGKLTVVIVVVLRLLPHAAVRLCQACSKTETFRKISCGNLGRVWVGSGKSSQ